MNQELEPWELDQDSEGQNQELTFEMEAWEMRGVELARKDTDVKWELGDWLNEGEPHCPEIGPGEIPGMPACSVYTYAEKITGLSRSTLRDLAKTARCVPESVRTPSCSWSHHRALARARPDADEETLRQWLKRAVDESMSVEQLHEALRARVKLPINEKSFVVTVPLAVWETLKDFADNKQTRLQKIASGWLLEKFKSEDTQTGRKDAVRATRSRRRENRRRVGLRVALDYDPLGLRR